MRLVVITAEGEPPGEAALLAALFAAGLRRCHVRKPGWPVDRVGRWVRTLLPVCRPRLVLHSHHELAETLGLGGRHWRDEEAPRNAGHGGACPRAGFTSRSCHDLATLQASLGRFDAVFLGPVFPSISKPGYTADPSLPAGLSALLRGRPAGARNTEVIALGGVTADRVACCREMGFDGVAVLGAVWLAEDPVAAFRGIQQAAGCERPAGHPPKAPAPPGHEAARSLP